MKGILTLSKELKQTKTSLDVFLRVKSGILSVYFNGYIYVKLSSKF